MKTLYSESNIVYLTELQLFCNLFNSLLKLLIFHYSLTAYLPIDLSNSCILQLYLSRISPLLPLSCSDKSYFLFEQHHLFLISFLHHLQLNRQFNTYLNRVYFFDFFNAVIYCICFYTNYIKWPNSLRRVTARVLG